VTTLRPFEVLFSA